MREIKSAALLFIMLLTLMTLSPVNSNAEPSAGDDGSIKVETVEIPLFSEGDIAILNCYTQGIQSSGRSVAPLSADVYDQLYEIIYDALEASRESIDIYHLGITDVNLVSQAYWDVVNYNPGLFYIGDKFTRFSVGETVKFIEPEYTMGGEELLIAKANYESTIESIVSLADPSWTPLETALFLHDYLAYNYEYDTDFEINSVDRFFESKKGVCNAYALAYRALLEEFGIESTYASSEEMNHIWNIIWLEDDWYHVDVTWDDPVPDRLGRVSHIYFLVSDDALRVDEDRLDWTSKVTCESKTYDNYYWKGVNSAFVYVEGDWYCISTTQASSTDDYSIFVVSGDELVHVVDLPFYWEVWDDPSYYWRGSYSGLGKFNDELYYNSPEYVYAYNPTAGQSRIALAPVITEGHIYGIRINDGIVDCLISKGPNLPTSESSIDSYPLKRAIGLNVVSLPEKTVYEMGENISIEDMTVKLIFDDGSQEVITNYVVSADLSEPGDCSVQISYADLYDNFLVTVCGFSIIQKSSGDYEAILVEKSDAKIDTCFVAGYVGGLKMVSLNTLNLFSKDGFVRAEGEISKGAGEDKFRVFLLDDSLSPMLKDRQWVI